MVHTSKEHAVKDWREYWEPADKSGNEVIHVNKLSPGSIEYAYIRKDGQMFISVCGSSLVPKAKPKKYRPWLPEEVPVGMTVRSKDRQKCAVIVEFDGSYISVGKSRHCFPSSMLEEYEKLDGSPCGMLEE